MKVSEDGRTFTPEHTWALRNFEGVTKHRSVWRAMRRGTVGRDGKPFPSRPFNNSKRTKGRKAQKEFEETKRTIDHILKKAQNIDTQNAKR